MDKLDGEIEDISKYLTEKQAGFDKVMTMSRDIIRDAGQAITMMHNDDKDKAQEKLSSMADTVSELKKVDSEYRYHTLQAYQEYAEAFIFAEIKNKRKIPGIRSVGVGEEAYLLGLMDVEGELKREILESLRADKLKEAEWYFETMKRIYDITRRLRFAEAVLGGFRKKQDTARIQIENAGSEILMFKSRKS